MDDLLLQDAYNLHKPVLGICYGLQSLNVYRAGSLVQHIESAINHSAGRAVPKAHSVTIEPESRLAEIVGASQTVAVNSSHHQSAAAAGDGLRVVARSAEDGIIEALEGTAPAHFVLAVQWHPERSVNDGPELAESARAIFARSLKRREPSTRNWREWLSPPGVSGAPGVLARPRRFRRLRRTGEDARHSTNS